MNWPRRAVWNHLRSALRSRATTALLAGLLIFATGMLAAGEGGLHAQGLPTEVVLVRAASYVGQFVDSFANVVAEEQYVQRNPADRLVREVLSDFLIVQVPETNDWMSFRDVIQVDGASISDRNERLVELFLNGPSVSAVERAGIIVQESSRFNLPGIGSLNNPLLALAFVQWAFNDRFTWNAADAGADLEPSIVELRFEETAVPTILTDAGGGDAPTSGSVWIDSSSGRVSKTLLWVDLGRRSIALGAPGNGPGGRGDRFGQRELPVQASAEITTFFEFDQRFGIAVPVEMRESYIFGSSVISTRATYGRFRRFGVQTTETFDESSVDSQ